MKSIVDCVRPTTDGRCPDPNQITAVAAEFGLALLDGDDVVAARELAASLLGEGIATLESYRTVRGILGSGIFGFFEGGQLTGLSASFSLNEHGLAEVKSGSFDALHLDGNLIAKPGDRPAAYYGWGFLGVTKRAAATVVLLSRAIHRRLFWGVPTYTRAVTPAGMRACLGLGFVPAPGDDATLVWIPPHAFVPGART
jgi:hypothetical protein